MTGSLIVTVAAVKAGQAAAQGGSVVDSPIFWLFVVPALIIFGALLLRILFGRR